MQSDEENIHHASLNIDWEVAKQIVDCLVQSKSTTIVGYYHSFSYAHWFYFLLHHLIDNTSLYRPETDIGFTNKGSGHTGAIIFSYLPVCLRGDPTCKGGERKGEQRPSSSLIPSSPPLLTMVIMFLQFIQLRNQYLRKVLSPFQC